MCRDIAMGTVYLTGMLWNFVLGKDTYLVCNYKTKKEAFIMCRIGDIYMARLDMDTEGSLQSGIRPVLVISNDKANQYSPVITIIPITSNTGKKRLPTHVFIRGCGLLQQSIVLVEQITSLNQTRLLRKIGSIQRTVYEEKIRNAIKVQLDM